MSLLNNNRILKNKAFNRPFVVKRTETGSWDTTTGKWAPGADQSPINASGSIQPARTQDLQWISKNVEGGQQVSAGIRIYSSFEFQPATLGAQGKGGDIVEHNGLDWIIIRIADYSGHGHQKVFGVRLDGQDG